MKLDMDIVCLTETHKWRDKDHLTIYSDLPPKDDKWSGVALVLNKRISKYVICSGSINSRLIYCRLRGHSCNILVIGVYIPQRKRKNPDQEDTYSQVESLLANVSRRDCV